MVSTGQSGGRTLWRYGILCVLVAALLRSSISPSRVGSNGFQVAEYDQLQAQYISRWLPKKCFMFIYIWGTEEHSDFSTGLKLPSHLDDV